MKPYNEYRPTCFDPAGYILDDDRQEWLVVPVGRTRDSGPMAESNFQAALDLLGGESDDVEVHRFGHWGPGWFEIIIVRPDSDSQTKAEDIEARLEDYPLLDDEDHSNREYEEFLSSWSDYGAGDFRKAIKKHFDLAEGDEDLLDDADDDTLRQFFMDHANIAYEMDGDSGVSINIDWVKNSMTDEQLSALFEMIEETKANAEKVPVTA